MVSTWLNSLVSGLVVSGAGYFGGGNDGSDTATVDKFSFSDDSRSTLGTGLSVAQGEVAAMANSGTAGYFGGGNQSGTVVDKFAFSDDSRSTLGTGLSSSRRAGAGMANSGTAGYFGGGGQWLAPVDKFAFSDDSRSTLGTGLSSYRNYLSAMANSGTAGYFAGGYNVSGSMSTVNKFAFSDDGIAWSEPEPLLIEHSLPAMGRPVAWQATILWDEDSSREGWLVYAYSKRWGPGYFLGTPHHMVGRRIGFERASDPN